MDEISRATKYIQAAGGAVSGNGGHNHTFGLVCRLIEHFDLSQAVLHDLLVKHHNPVCDPPWSDQEMRHKVESAFKVSSYKGDSTAPRKPIEIVKREVPKSFEYRYDGPSKRPIPDEIEDGARRLIRACFREGEGIRIVHPELNEEGKETPNAGMTFSREWWLKELDKHNGKVNEKGGMLRRVGDPGIYVAINPLEQGKVADANVTDYRHALLEFDELDTEKQWQLYVESELPIAAVIHSGVRSLHAWVKVNAKDRKEYKERVEAIYDHFSAYNPDTKNKNPSRLSRLPNCIRMGARQRLLAVDLGKASFSEWQADRAIDGVGQPVTINELMNFNAEADPNSILGSRWLCKGGAAMFIGPSGIGKSTLLTQAAVEWGMGRDCFGIKPIKPLKSLILQAENDVGDIAEQMQGILGGMGLDEFEHEQEFDMLKDNIVFVRDTIHTGKAFTEAMRQLIDYHKPDLVWIDPLLSFLGDDVSKQSVCSQFLRNWINPIAETTGVVFMMVHHTGKPPKDAKAMESWTASDYAYLGTGSSELTNWARAVCVLRQLDDETFQLKLAKRGKRAGATDLNGEPTTDIYLKHGTSGIRWIQENAPPEPVFEETPKRNTGGRKRIPFDSEGWLAFIEGEKMPYRELVNSAVQYSMQTGGPKKSKIETEISILKNQGKLEKVDSQNWMHVKCII